MLHGSKKSFCRSQKHIIHCPRSFLQISWNDHQTHRTHSARFSALRRTLAGAGITELHQTSGTLYLNRIAMPPGKLSLRNSRAWTKTMSLQSAPWHEVEKALPFVCFLWQTMYCALKISYACRGCCCCAGLRRRPSFQTCGPKMCVEASTTLVATIVAAGVCHAPLTLHSIQGPSGDVPRSLSPQQTNCCRTATMEVR